MSKGEEENNCHKMEWTFMQPTSQMLVSLPRINATTQTEELLLALQDKRRNKRVMHRFSSLLKKLDGLLLPWD